MAGNKVLVLDDDTGKKNKNNTKATPSTPKSSGGSGGRGGSGGSGGRGGSGGGGGGSSIKKSSDKPQVKALKKLLKSGLKKTLDQQKRDMTARYKEADALLVHGYRDRLWQLNAARRDNDASEHDSSFRNLANRARESNDSLAQLAAQGAGETDVLRGQMMAARNWDANQGDINRSYYDTNTQINSALTDLNASTRENRVNAWNQWQDDVADATNQYYGKRADAWAQLGGIRSNAYSDSYSKDTKAYNNMAKASSKTYDKKGAPDKLTEWDGAKATEERLNNTRVTSAEKQAKITRPSGATLNTW